MVAESHEDWLVLEEGEEEGGVIEGSGLWWQGGY